MTHFIGAVLVPASVERIMNTRKTPFPDLDGSTAKEWVAGTALNDFLDDALEQFSEEREVNIWQPKAMLIEKERKNIEEYRDGIYAKYLADPEAYAKSFGTANPDHLKYVSTEFPLKLEWTDEEVYKNEVLKWVETEDIRESDGAIHTSYNPQSKWDWWVIGGRWEETYRDKQGQLVGEFRAMLEETLSAMQDPKGLAELEAVQAEIEAVNAEFQKQRDVYRAAQAKNSNAGHEAWEAAVVAAFPGEKILTWDDTDKARAKLVECSAYMPWWFPFSLVTKEYEVATDETTNERSGYEWRTAGRMGWFGAKSEDMQPIQWVEKLIEILSDRNDDDYIVYLDFHI